MIGQYQHNIDAKGRLFIPAKYREELGDAFYVTIGLDGCLSVYDQPYQGRNRRYYAITRRGQDRLEQIRGEWRQLRNNLDHLLLEGTEDE